MNQKYFISIFSVFIFRENRAVLEHSIKTMSDKKRPQIELFSSRFCRKISFSSYQSQRLSLRNIKDRLKTIKTLNKFMNFSFDLLFACAKISAISAESSCDRFRFDLAKLSQ
jgi:hypothetical protein